MLRFENLVEDDGVAVVYVMRITDLVEVRSRDHSQTTVLSIDVVYRNPYRDSFEGANGPIVTVLMPRCGFASLAGLTEQGRPPDNDVFSDDLCNGVQYLWHRSDLQPTWVSINDVRHIVSVGNSLFGEEAFQFHAQHGNGLRAKTGAWDDDPVAVVFRQIFGAQ